MKAQAPPSDVRDLAREMLALYEKALRLGQLDAAEHLLTALEELARSHAGCRAVRNQAYLAICPGSARRLE